MWLNPPDPSTNLVATTHTTSWFIESHTFLEWGNGLLPHLWINGTPGCGKTVLACSALRTLGDRAIYYFFDFSDFRKQTYDGFIRSLVCQLSGLHTSVQKDLENLFRDHDNGRKQVETSRLVEVLERNLSAISTTNIVVDALDECTEPKQVLSWLRKVCQMHEAVRLIITSRPLEFIKAEILQWIPIEAAISADGEATKKEISEYVLRRLDEGDEFKDWRSIPDGTWRQKIERTLLSEADGMFRWAALQLDALAACRSLHDLENTLRDLPANLYQTYDRVLLQIPKINRQSAVHLLQFLLYSEGNLRIDEAMDIMAVNLTEDRPFNPKNRMRGQKDVSDTLPGLIKLLDDPETNERSVILALAHASVKDYLLSTEISTPFNHSFSEVTAKTEMVQICISYFNSITSEFNATANKNLSQDKIAGKFPLVRHIIQLEHEKKEIKHSRLTWMRLFEIEVAWKLASQNKIIYPRPLWMCFLEHEGVQKATFQLVSEFLRDETPNYIIFTDLYDEKISYNYRGIWRSHGPIFFAILSSHFDLVQLLIKNARIIHNRASRLIHRHFAQFRRPKPVVNLMPRIFHPGFEEVEGSLLYTACERGNKHIIELLLDKGADPNECGGSTFTLICSKGDIELVKLFVDRGAYVKSHEQLEAACETGNKSIIELLFDNGANPNEYRGLAFLLVCSSGDIELVRMFLDRGADVNLQYNQRSNPLRTACVAGNLELVRLLIERGARMSHGGSAELADAASSGNSELVEFLIDQGADLNDTYYRVLMDALKDRNFKLTRLLLDHGANIRLEAEESESLLELASMISNVQVVQFLLDRGTDPSGFTSPQTPLEAVCRFGSGTSSTCLKIAQLLLDHGADVNQQFPLMKACQASKPNPEVIQLLLDRGADVNKGSPLEHVCQASEPNLEVLKLLLDGGADVNEGSPLELLCEAAKSDLEAVKLLLDRGANVNGTNGSPLKSACRNANLKLAQLLLERGADINTSTDNHPDFRLPDEETIKTTIRQIGHEYSGLVDYNASILAVACAGGSIDIVKLLIERGASIHADGRRPLFMASYSSNPAMVQALLDLGMQASPGYSQELAAACCGGNSSVAKLLLDLGADPNGFSGGYLVVASANGSIPVIRLLIQYGAEVNKSPYEHWFALDSADTTKLAQVLREYGAV